MLISSDTCWWYEHSAAHTAATAFATAECPHRIKLLTAEGHDLHIVPQNLVELWVVATCPADRNGLGMTPASAAEELARLKGIFLLLPETAAIYPVWEGLVTQHRVSGKPAHDAGLVAAMQVHGLNAILTFDRRGFGRFPGIQVVDPAQVAKRAQAISLKFSGTV
jgi:predicted nucleic acid-binding protein